MTAARLARTRAQTALLRHQLAEREGRIVPREAVLQLEQLRLQELRQGIQAVPARLAPRILGLKDMPEALRIVDAEMRELLETLGRTGAVIRDRLRSIASPPAVSRPRRRGRARG